MMPEAYFGLAVRNSGVHLKGESRRWLGSEVGMSHGLHVSWY